MKYRVEIINGHLNGSVFKAVIRHMELGRLKVLERKGFIKVVKL